MYTLYFNEKFKNTDHCCYCKKRTFEVIQEGPSTFLTGCSFIPPQTHPEVQDRNPVCSSDE